MLVHAVGWNLTAFSTQLDNIVPSEIRSLV